MAVEPWHEPPGQYRVLMDQFVKLAVKRIADSTSQGDAEGEFQADTEREQHQHGRVCAKPCGERHRMRGERLGMMQVMSRGNHPMQDPAMKGVLDEAVDRQADGTTDGIAAERVEPLHTVVEGVGDGAGAAVLTPSREGEGEILATELGTDGQQTEILNIPGGG